MYIQIISYNDETNSASDPSGIGRIGDDGGGGGDSDVLYTCICNPKIAADHANRHYQGAYTESEAQNLEHGVDECVIPMAVHQKSVHQQYNVEEEHKNPLMVRNAHANYHPGALQFEEVPVQQ